MGTGEDFFWGVLHGFQGERVGDRSLPKEYKGGDFLELTDHQLLVIKGDHKNITEPRSTFYRDTIKIF